MSYLSQSNNSGLIDIKCIKCGTVICQTPYNGFSTATCHKCAKVNPADESKPIEVKPLTAEDEESLTFMEEVSEAVSEATEEVVETVKEVVQPIVEAIKKRVVKKTGKPVGKKLKFK